MIISRLRVTKTPAHFNFQKHVRAHSSQCNRLIINILHTYADSITWELLFLWEGKFPAFYSPRLTGDFRCPNSLGIGLPISARPKLLSLDSQV